MGSTGHAAEPVFVHGYGHRMTHSQMGQNASRLQLRPIEVGDAARIDEWASQPEAC